VALSWLLWASFFPYTTLFRSVRLGRVLGRSGRAAAGPAARHRRRRDLGGAAAAGRANGRGHHAAAVRLGSGRAGGLPVHLDRAGDRRGGREHGRPDPARRLRDGRVRHRRRRPGRGHAGPRRGARRAGAGPGGAGSRPARGRRPGRAAGGLGAGFPHRTGAPADRPRPRAQAAGAGRDEAAAERQALLRPALRGPALIPALPGAASGGLVVEGRPLGALVLLRAGGAARAGRGGAGGTAGGDVHRVLAGQQLVDVGVAPGLADDAARVVLARVVLPEVLDGDAHLVLDRAAGILDPAAGLAHPLHQLPRHLREPL